MFSVFFFSAESAELFAELTSESSKADQIQVKLALNLNPTLILP
jgi:hypothetical protein